jgi:hypothetical protein
LDFRRNDFELSLEKSRAFTFSSPHLEDSAALALVLNLLRINKAARKP